MVRLRTGERFEIGVWMRRGVIVGLLMAVSAVSCADPTSEPRASGPSGATTTGPTATGEVPTGPTATDPGSTERVGLLQATIDWLMGREAASWRTVEILVDLCTDAFDGALPTACVDRLSDEEQAAIASWLDGRGVEVEFVRSLEGGGELDGSLIRIWLGPPEDHGVEAWVPGSMVCGGLCGRGSVWALVRTADGWRVEGSAPGAAMWIA